MLTSSSRVDLLIQYAVLLSGEQEDFSARSLGPIHLVKYVYLADLFYARRNNGIIFTKTKWQFYKFGPWSQSVHERVEPAMNTIGAEKQTFQSEYEDRRDWVRWRLRDEKRLTEIENQLPFEITSGLKEEVHHFGQDTQGLLHYVYGTEPMLSAAPNEFLDFSIVENGPLVDQTAQGPLRMESLSNKEKKEFKERMRTLRARYKKRERKDDKLTNPVQDARYDDVYDAGVLWLDSLAGEPFEEGTHTVSFSNEVWKSSTRKGADVP